MNPMTLETLLYLIFKVRLRSCTEKSLYNLHEQYSIPKMNSKKDLKNGLIIILLTITLGFKT